MNKHNTHNIVKVLSTNIQTQYRLPKDSNTDFDQRFAHSNKKEIIWNSNKWRH